MATDLPNPFWSEAVQQEFQRTQQQAETAGDRDASTMREIDETQQEPNYQLESREQVPSGAVGLTAQDQTVFQAGPVSSNDSGNMPGHGSVQIQPTITSPAPRSVAGLNDFSNMERGLGLREARVDDQELVPDYASMPAPPGLQSALLTGMGDMMRELLQTQLTAQLAPVFERLGRLESERSSEVSAVSALEAPEMMTLARVEARQTEAQVAVPALWILLLSEADLGAVLWILPPSRVGLLLGMRCLKPLSTTLEGMIAALRMYIWSPPILRTLLGLLWARGIRGIREW